MKQMMVQTLQMNLSVVKNNNYTDTISDGG